MLKLRFLSWNVQPLTSLLPISRNPWYLSGNTFQDFWNYPPENTTELFPSNQKKLLILRQGFACGSV